MPNLGVPELLIILGIIVLLFGTTRLPQLGKGLGESIRNFRHGLRGDDDASPREDERSNKA